MDQSSGSHHPENGTAAPAAAEASALSKEERLRIVKQEFWVGHSKAKLVHEQLDELMTYPKCQRMPNLAVIGESNSGKSLLLKRFRDRHVPPVDPQADRTELPVFMIEVPAEPDESRLYGEMLQALFAEGSVREPVEAKLRRIQHLLTALETKVIVMDEFQNALAGSVPKIRKFLNGIKYLGNKLQIPIVVAGTPETLNVLRSDPQMANRFPPAIIPKWTIDEEFRRLLASFEKYMPLREPSNLSDKKMAQRILALSEGTIGEVLTIIRVLAKDAIKRDVEQIRFQDLEMPRLKSLGWVPPSERSRYTR